MLIWGKFSFLIFLLFTGINVFSNGWKYQQNVIWNTPSVNALGSMPLGGGDIGCNVWVENGDILFYLQRSGSFSENGEYLKMGRFRMRLSPNPFIQFSAFRQEQHLSDGVITISASDSGNTYRVTLWVDIFTHSLHVDVESDREVALTVSYENWRTEERLLSDKDRGRFGCFGFEAYPGDVVKSADEIRYEGTAVLFYHRNGKDNLSPDFMLEQQQLTKYKDEIVNHNRYRTSGGCLFGENLKVAQEGQGVYCGTPFRSWNLESVVSAKRHHWAVTTHVGQAEQLAGWMEQLDENRKETTKTRGNLSKNKTWWQQFSQRSWIVTDPFRKSNDSLLWQMGQNYQRVRYQLGCNLYGEYPTKFNGGNFTVDPVLVNQKQHDPDWRQWGGDLFTAQNQRLLYWPMLKAGDCDGLKSQFNLYEWGLAGAKAKVKEFFGHNGAMYCEYANAAGLEMPSGWGWNSEKSSRMRGKEVPFGDPSIQATSSYGGIVEEGIMANGSISYHWESQIEHAYMMLEYHRFTGENIDRYLPFIKNALIFFDEHYQLREKIRTGKPLDANGKLNIYPSTSCESYRGAKNPIDVVCGIEACMDELLKLKTTALTAADRTYFGEFRKRLPGIFYDEVKGDRIIKPAETYVRYQNVECPQFYPLFPFNRFDLESAQIPLFRNTWKHGSFAKGMVISWHQDGIFFARMGMVDEALDFNKRKLKNAPCRYPTFWGPGHDWVPDHNWGGCGMIGLQEMVLQTVGDKIHVLPAWPEGKDVMFKLHAPDNTTVEVEYIGGELKKLEVYPKHRRKDVVIGIR